MAVLNEKFLKVDYPNPNSLRNYLKIKVLGGKILRSKMLKWLGPITQRIISVSKPSGSISIQDTPEFIKRKIGDEQIAIMTANLWHDWPRNRKLKERLKCFVELVKEESADILILQELTRTQEFKADEWLSDQLGMAFVYSRANGHAAEIGFEEGLAIFSRFPIGKPRLAQLSDQKNPFYRRIALGASVHTHSGIFLAFSAHLAINSRKNRTQFSRLKTWVDDQSGNVPAVIGGDFNAREQSPQIRYAQNSWSDSFREINPQDEGYTHELQWPWGGNIKKSRLDYLFLRKGELGWIVEEARNIEMDECLISDHKPVLIKARIDQ